MERKKERGKGKERKREREEKGEGIREGKEEGKRERKKREWKRGRKREKKMEKEKEEKEGEGKVEGEGKGEEKGKRKGKGKGRWKEDSLRNIGRTDTKVILYFVQCYVLHWTDKNYKKRKQRKKDGVLLTKTVFEAIVPILYIHRGMTTEDYSCHTDKSFAVAQSLPIF